MSHKEIWQMTIEERLERLSKRIPKNIYMNNEIVKSVADVSLADREKILYDLNRFLITLESHHHWWSKVKNELQKPPKLKVIPTIIDMPDNPT